MQRHLGVRLMGVDRLRVVKCRTAHRQPTGFDGDARCLHRARLIVNGSEADGSVPPGDQHVDLLRRYGQLESAVLRVPMLCSRQKLPVLARDLVVGAIDDEVFIVRGASRWDLCLGAGIGIGNSHTIDPR